MYYSFITAKNLKNEEYEVGENRIQLNKHLRLFQLSMNIEINKFNPSKYLNHKCLESQTI